MKAYYHISYWAKVNFISVVEKCTRNIFVTEKKFAVLLFAETVSVVLTYDKQIGGWPLSQLPPMLPSVGS